MRLDKVLVIGSTGLLGPYLMRAMGPGAVGAARSGAEVDLDCRDAQAVAEALRRVRPDAVVLALGFTDVDGCERDPEKARAVNEGCARNVASALGADVPLVYISTDQVYPDTPGPHAEGGEGPVNEYGASKLAGERAALAHPRSLVLRVNLFGPSLTPGRASLSDFFEGALRAGEPVTLFADVLFSPLHMRTLSALVAEALSKGLTGVYNLGSRDGMSKHDFALALAAHKSLSTGSATRGESSRIPGRAVRPHDMRMDVSRIEQALGRTLPTLKKEIELL